MDNTNFIFENLSTYKHQNGLTIILKRNKKIPVVSVQYWVKAGSLFEDDRNNGISHFLEHLVFKGTKKYDMRQITNIVEKYGAVINAGTSKEFTMYYVDIIKDGFEDALKILSSMMFEASFPSEEVEKERNVVLEEIKRAQDNPEDVLYEMFNSLIFTKTNYKYKIIGCSTNIKSFTREEIINYYKSFYHPKNMLLSISGDIDIEETKNLINKTLYDFSNNIADYNLQKTITILDEDNKEDILKLKKHNVQHTHFLCGFLGPKINDEMQFSAEVFSIIFGEGISSRIYKSLREEKKLVYEIGCGFYTQIGPSLFYISGICERKNLDNVVLEIKKEINQILESGVKKEELEKAKNLIKTRWYFGTETVHAQASNFAWWHLFKSLDDLRSYIDNIEKVRSEDIQNFLKKYYNYLIVSALEP